MKRMLALLLALLCLTGCAGAPEDVGGENAPEKATTQTTVAENEFAPAEARIAAGDYAGALEALAALDRYPQIEEKIVQAQEALDEQERAFLWGTWKEVTSGWQVELYNDGTAVDSDNPDLTYPWICTDGWVYLSGSSFLALEVTDKDGITHLVGSGFELVSQADYAKVGPVEIEITMDNWAEYFLVEEGTVVNEGKDRGFYHCIALRDEYTSRVIPMDQGYGEYLDVAFRVEWQDTYYRYTGDYPYGDYTVGGKYVPTRGSKGGTTSYVTEMLSYMGDWYKGTPFYDRFAWGGIDDQNLFQENGVKYLLRFENLRVLDAVGTLKLRPDPEEAQTETAPEPTEAPAPVPAAGTDGDALLAAGEYAAAIEAFRSEEGYARYAELKTLARKKLAEQDGAFLLGVWTDRQNREKFEFCAEGVFKPWVGQPTTYVYRDGIVYLDEDEKLGYFLREERGLTCLVSPRGTFFRQEDLQKVRSVPVEITPENFWVYFEAEPLVYVSRDRFGDIKFFQMGTALVLKEEYQQRLDAYNGEPRLEIYAQYRHNEREVLGDYPNGEYEIIRSEIRMTYANDGSPLEVTSTDWGLLSLWDNPLEAESSCQGKYAICFKGYGDRAASAAEYPYVIRSQVPAGDTRTFTSGLFFDEFVILSVSGGLQLLPK